MMSLPSIPIHNNNIDNPPSPSSTADSSDAPRTPGDGSSGGHELGNNTNNTNNASTGKPARKPSRRANTAERRATHNAVERQRRETLNGRFMDLAALLPNLSQIRRPSKSSIVNSSIAHIHASRRHRILASRELRMLKVEADALRRELNEWRDRAGIQRLEEPQRGEGFGIVLSGELEVIVQGVEEEDEEPASYDGGAASGALHYDYDQSPPHHHHPHPAVAAAAAAHAPHPFAEHPAAAHHPAAAAYHLPRPTIQLPMHQHGVPMIASPTGMAFENPQTGYYSAPASAMPITPASEEKGWLMQHQQQQQQQQRRSSVSSSNGPGGEYVGMNGSAPGGGGGLFAPMF